MQEGIEWIGKFVVSGSDSTELLEAIEEALDEMACFVAMSVDGPFGLAVAAWWDVGNSTRCFNVLDQLIAVISLVGGDGCGLDAGDQGGALRDISHLPAGQDQANGVAQGIDAGVNLGGQPTSRTADRLIATVFLGAPAECWWARTMVASMNSSSRSASPWTASASRLHTPPTSQRANRIYTECHFPKFLGKSRQGQPVRAMNKTASTKRRLSAAPPPLSVGLPGSKCAICNHCLSFNISRFMCHTHIPGCKHNSATVNRP